MRILFLILILGLPLFAQEQDTDLFYQANEDFTAGNYGAAQEKYEQLLEDGFDNNWQLYYNLGNAHYEQDQAGSAALNYYRALRLKPKNKLVSSNLELLETKIKLKACLLYTSDAADE